MDKKCGRGGARQCAIGELWTKLTATAKDAKYAKGRREGEGEWRVRSERARGNGSGPALIRICVSFILGGDRMEETLTERHEMAWGWRIVVLTVGMVVLVT